jgi:hypothetical protein
MAAMRRRSGRNAFGPTKPASGRLSITRGPTVTQGPLWPTLRLTPLRLRLSRGPGMSETRRENPEPHRPPHAVGRTAAAARALRATTQRLR